MGDRRETREKCIDSKEEQAYCMLNWPMVNRVSYIPVVFVRARKTSASMGVYVGPHIRVTSSKKLYSIVSIPFGILYPTF